MTPRSPTITHLISPKLNAKLRKIATSKTYSDGQIIHNRGDIKPGLSIVRKGAAHVGTFGKDGSFISITVLGIGQTFGEVTLFASLPRTQDITAVGQTEIDQIPGPLFFDIYEKEPSLAHALMMIALLRSHALLEDVTNGRRMSVPILLAKIILDQSIIEGTSGTVTTRQSDLAATLGVSRYTVSKALKKLADQGLITLGYGQLEIPDIKTLQIWAEQRSAVETLSRLD